VYDIDDLRTFMAIVDAGGVAAAARRLKVSKSIVSRRLVRLERALGAQLISRTTRGVGLTEAGAIFRDHATRAAAELEAANEAIAPHGDLRGLLRVSAPLSFGLSHVAPVIAELARRHPRLQVDANYTDRFVDLVGEGFDAAIRVGYLSDSSLIARRIAAIGGRFVASPAYIAAHGAPVTPEDIQHHQALMQGTEQWRFMADGKQINVRVSGRFKADNGEALVAATLAGVGVSMVPDFLVEAHIASGALVPVMVDYPPPEAGLFVLRAPGDFPPRKVRALIDILIERFGEGSSLASRSP